MQTLKRFFNPEGKIAGDFLKLVILLQKTFYGKIGESIKRKHVGGSVRKKAPYPEGHFYMAGMGLGTGSTPPQKKITFCEIKLHPSKNSKYVWGRKNQNLIKQFGGVSGCFPTDFPTSRQLETPDTAIINFKGKISL